MRASQPDLFADPAPRVSEEMLASIRARLHAKLALVREAATMPWSDQLTIIHEDNGFRFAKDLLPPEEGAALWAAFDVEMNRLYALLNEGREAEE